MARLGPIGNNSSVSDIIDNFNLVDLDFSFRFIPEADLEEMRIKREKVKKSRRETYELRDTLQSLTQKWANICGEFFLFNDVATPEIRSYYNASKIQTKCCGKREIPAKSRPDKSDHIEIVKQQGIARWRNVRKCKNSRFCPVCSFKKMADEKVKLDTLKGNCALLSYSYVMVTLTRPHTIKDKLSDMLAEFSAVLKLMFSGETWDLWKKDNDYVGMVRSEEILFNREKKWLASA